MNTSQVSGIIRHVLTTVGGGLGYDGITGEQSNLQTGIGLLLVIAGIVHSAWVKRPAAKTDAK